MDFVLWKPSADDLPGWDSPWGRGRPGWHIECSAMTEALFGPSFDIHGGGTDLLFPHHENEVAQSCCAHPDGGFAQIWLHNEMLQVEGRKMSKSLGNFFTIRDLLDQGIPGEVVRLVMLSTHYRKPMDWTDRKRADAEATLRKWREMVADVEPGEISSAVVEAIADDLNTAGAIAELFKLANAGDLPTLKASAQMLGFLTEEMGGWDKVDTGDHGARIEALLQERAEARAAKDFARADALRDGFAAAGVLIKDTPQGATWEAGPGFDPSKLDEL